MKCNELTREDIRKGVAIAVLRAFADRKGHGGGACTRRVMTREQLKRFGNAAIQRAMDVAEARERTST